MNICYQMPIERKILLYSQIINSKSNIKIALTPYGEYSKIVKESLNKDNIVFLDENKDLIDNATIYDLKNKNVIENLDLIIITSYTYYDVLEKKLLRLGINKTKILNLGKPIQLNRENIKMFNLSEYGLQLLNISKRYKKIVLFIGPYFYDIYEKIAIIKKYHEDYLVVWQRIDAPYFFKYNKKYDFYEFNNLVDILVLLKNYKLDVNTTIITIHPISYYNLVYYLKEIAPNINIIPYIYDWLNLFCPYRHKELYKKYRKLSEKEVEEEYKSLENIINAKKIAGIIYKDGDENFELLEHFTKPKLFFPAVKSKDIFMPLRKEQKRNLKKIVFIGSIFSESTNLPDLFKDAILFDIFEKVLKLNFSIDVFYSKNDKSIENEYKEYFKIYNNFSIDKGDLLENLFPKIVGQYGWGWMIYDDDYPIVKEHVKYTLPSKIFAYLALGVPIIVINDFKNSAKLVKKYGIGIVIDKKEIDQLPKIIEQVDYDLLLRNIKETREIFNLENYEAKFIDFLQKIIK